MPKFKYFLWNGIKIINSMIANGTIAENKLTPEVQEKINSGGMHNYSSDEQIVGTLIDGKPIYEKTYVIPKNLLSGYSSSYAHNISNIDRVIQINTVAKQNVSGVGALDDNTHTFIPFAYTTKATTDNRWYGGGHITKTDITFDFGEFIFDTLTDVIVTIQYTKNPIETNE